MSDRLSALERDEGRLVVLPSFDPVRDRIELVMPPGATIADAIALALPGLAPAQHAQLRVTIGGDVVPQEAWHRVRPKRWGVTLIRVILGAGSLLQSSLIIAVTLAAAVVAYAIAGPVAAGLTEATGIAISAAFVQTAAATALMLAGTALVYALVPTRKPDELKGKQVFALDGLSNQIMPDGPVPNLAGGMRFAPPFAAYPYSEIVGNDRFIRFAFLIGVGPVDLSAWAPRLGMTDLLTFDGIEIETREGYATDEPLTLYNRQVIEEALSVSLTGWSAATGYHPQTRAFARDATRGEIEFFFPGGLLFYDSDAVAHDMTVQFAVKYRALGAADWTALSNFFVTAKTLTPFWRALAWDFPERGDYEVEITRITAEFDDAVFLTERIMSRSTWSAIRSVRPEYPFNYDAPMAMVAGRIRASGQLNGTLDTFNLFARRLAPDWDAGTETWITRATSNPASIARLVLQGPQNKFPDPDAAIALDDFQDWHEHCTAKGLKYDAYILEEMTREDALADVCHAGRAEPYWRGAARSIVIDRPRTQFVDHISPRNSAGLVERDPPATPPDAYAISFLDQTSNYSQARAIVPLPGFASDEPVVIEELALPGKTDPTEIWIEARRRGYETALRRRGWTVSQGPLHLVLGQGDAAFLAHPVIDRRQSGGRVRAVMGSLVEIDELVTMEAGGTYRCRFRTGDGTEIDREVLTAAGTTGVLTLAAGTMPEPGDHAMFYSTVAPALEVIAKSIERNESHDGFLTLVDHAPQLDALVEAEIVPPWTGRYGQILHVLLLEEGGEALLTEDEARYLEEEG